MEEVPHRLDSATCLYLVEERANPSTDYFVLPRLAAAGVRVVRCSFEALPDASELKGADVLFVRYVPAQWARLVGELRPQLRRVIYFMDDDLLDVTASAGMPLRYRFKLARLAAWRKGWLQRMGAEMWVSSRWLLEKYAVWQPRLIEPSPLAEAGVLCRLFYHGSAAHEAEIRWLRPVVAEVLEHEHRLSFEIIGGQQVYRLYRDLPRVTVVHPLKWPAYQAFLGLGERHIGLAPLLDSDFNKARSCTKFFDFTRGGAVGLYSQQSVYGDFVRDGVDGLLLPNEQGAWIEAILTLAGDEPRRLALLHAAQQRQVELAAVSRDNGDI